MSRLEKIIYLTKSQYNTLNTGGTTTVGGTTLNGINDDYIYITSDPFNVNDLDGVLSINRGGTGLTSIANNSMLIGNSDGEFTTINKTTSITSNSTDNEIPTAKTVYTYINNGVPKASYLTLYESRATTTTLNKTANYVGAGTLFHLIASSNTNTTDNGKPPMGDANVLHMNWDNNGGYDAQLAISTSANRMEFRDQPSTKKAWREVVTSTPGTAAGDTTVPVYINSTGVAIPISTTAAAANGGTNLTLVTTGEKYTWNNKSDLTIGSTSTQAMAGNTTVTNVAITADTTTNASYPLVFGTTSTTAAKTESLQKNSAKFYVNPSTGNIQATTFNGFALAAACAKSVVTSVDTSASLPTSNAVKTFVENKGYTTNTGTVTSITLKAGAGIALDTDNTAITVSGSRTISISGVNTSTGNTVLWLNQKGGWTTPPDTKVEIIHL